MGRARRLAGRHLHRRRAGATCPRKFTDAEDNESTSFLPGDAESTEALEAAEELQGGELAPAVIVYRRESGLTAADRRQIAADVGRLTEERFPGVVADGATAAVRRPGRRARRRRARRPAAALPEGCAGPDHARSRASPRTTRRSWARSARPTARPRS